ncbi:MAG: pitrilysin family protein [Bryobacteraceae bacterium]|nr:pitrilysin family protein [Bryobacteraceae bacterium]
MNRTWMRLVSTAACLALPLCAQDLKENLKDFEKRITEFTLANGMHFIVLERHNAPTVAFHAYVNVGAANDPAGRTGLAHMFEHMIGKGTTTVGSKNWAAEKQALAAVEAVYAKLEEERRKEFRANAETIKNLQAELDAAIRKANDLVVPNEYVRVIEQNGAVGFNAGTANDATFYFYSLPSNRAELWFLLTSQWFRQPVFREFYKERDVVREERRMRVESNPIGKLQEVLLSTALAAHPYRSLVGWASDIERLTVRDAEEFFKTYYVPGNITVAVAGDIDPARAKQLAEKYFGPLPRGPLPPRVRTEEPRQEGEKRVAVETPSQPFIFLAWHRPGQYHKDDPVFDVLANILSSGRTGLLYKEMIEGRKVALEAVAFPTFPSGKYANLFVMASATAAGKTVEENEKAFGEILDKLRKEKVDDATLNRVKTKLRASLVRQLDSNSGLASQLASYHANYGDWRKLFTQIEDIDRVTADDVQRVVREYLKDSTRTVGHTVAPKETK